jgi:hypothetical protein
MCGLEYDGGSTSCVEGFLPAGHAETPFVAGFKAGKTELGFGSAEVISVHFGELQELLSHHGADRVKPAVIGSGAAIPIAIEAGQRIATAALQFSSEDVRWHEPNSPKWSHPSRARSQKRKGEPSRTRFS